MIITKLTIENFRCYYGRQVIEFDTDGRITILYGLSGAGKTSFLECINWILYNKNDFLNLNINEKHVENHPIYNLKVEAETVYNSTFNVSGTLEFIHDGVTYIVERKEVFKRQLKQSIKIDNGFTLLYREENNWVDYSGDIPSKINEIVPVALSKYFFFHGEKMNLLNEEDKDLKEAIYNLFDINKYEEALKDLGAKNASQTIIHKYYSDRNDYLPNKSNADHKEIFRKMTKCRELSEEHLKNKQDAEDELDVLNERQNELTKLVINKTSDDEFHRMQEKNRQLIIKLEEEIQREFFNIGKNLYKSVPYLMLRDITNSTVRILAKEASDIDKNKSEVFKYLTSKDLLKEIVEKGVCICNRPLDNEALIYIENTIKSMPPDSYVMQLKQFGGIAKDYYNLASTEYENKFESCMRKITEDREEIRSLNLENDSITEKLKQNSSVRDYAIELQEVQKNIGKIRAKREFEQVEYEKFLKAGNKYEQEYDQICSALDTKKLYDDKISVLELIKKEIRRLKEEKILNTRSLLEKNVVEIYNILSTRKEDFTNQRFVNDDFSLRKVVRSGGQEVIDVYSYIIGMIKALKSLDDKVIENEFPIVIDAPFSKTDVIQATHVFDTLPRIASQVIILSLELNKFKNSINDKMVGHTYFIQSDEEHKVTTIKKCTIKELFELENKHSNIAKGEEV